jgi:Carboxypeptidase regulatory-like domain
MPYCLSGCRRGICIGQLLLGLAMALWSWSPSTAQVVYGSIVGRISDSSAAVVKDASVFVTDLGTGESRISTTNGDGDYRFVNLVPGRYRIDVKAAGFKILSRDPIDVRVDTVVRIDAALSVGSVNESVVIQEQTPPLDTQNSSVGQVIEGRQVQETPLNGRNVMNLLALVPGVIPQGATQGSTAGNYTQSGDFTNVAGFGNYQIAGGLAGQNAFFFDGSPLNEVMSNDTVLVPTQDTVHEFRVVTNVLSPEIGALAGGAVSFTSKSGSNAYHGSLYEYLRNTVLDANNFFNNLSGIPRPQLIQNQFGVTIGGPIVKNRTFFFFNYERFTRRNGIPFEGRVPTPAELSGDFRADSPIYDPLTRQQFTCNGMTNVICPNRIDATANVMGNVLHYWPLPNANLAGGTVNYIANAAAGVDTNQYNVRIDQIVSDKQRLFGRYTYWNINTLPTQYIFGNSGGPTSAVRGLVADQQAVIGDVYTFSPSMVGDFRISYLHANTPITPANNNVNLSQFGPFWAGISSSLTHQQFPAPYIVNTIPSPFAGLDVTNNDTGNNYALAASITKVVGRHTLKFGADVRRYQFREGQTVFAPGFFIFAGIFTGGALSPPGSGATPIADFVLGAITPVPGASGFQTAVTSHATQWYQGYYFNDTFQASSKLTISAGLRWDIPGLYTEENDRNTVLQPQLQNPLVLVNSPQYPSRNDLESHYHLFAPRVGLAYQLHNQTVLRTGYGINFLPQGVSNVGPWESPINTAMTNVPFGGTLSNPLLGRPLLQPIGRSQSAFSTFLGQSVQSRIPNQPFPYVQQWNLNIQQGFGSGSLFQIAYLGSRGDHLPLGVPTLETGDVGADLNQLSPQYYSLGPALLQSTSSGQIYGQTLRPYPLYQQVSADSDFAGDTYYNSLQATLELRFSSGSMLLANYSWSKLTSDTEGINIFLEPYTVGAIQDYTNLRAERSLDSFDVPQRFVLSYVLDLPVGRGRRYLANVTGLADKLLSGWKLAGITTFASGFPLAITSAAPNYLSTLFGAGTIRPNVVAGCDKAIAGSIVTNATTGISVVNPACFAAPGPFALGNEARVDPTLRAQGINNWDIALSKVTPMGERVNLAFGAEFFNMFNRVQFGSPNTSFGSALFGKITTQVNIPRQIQFSLRTSF